MKLGKIVIAGSSLVFLFATVSYAAELDIEKPRVPADQMAAAKAMRPPFPVSAGEIAKGKDIFTGVGTCFTCHGAEGKGDGPGANGMDPSPRNFTNHTFDQLRTAGEMVWVVSNGSPLQPAMVGFVSAGQITPEQAWEAVLYERSLGCGGDMDCVSGTADWVAKQPVHEKSATNLKPNFLGMAAR
jgi:mono/diheme cytochrome c family protein